MEHQKSTCDLVIIGAGAAGLSAAVIASSGGAKVIVLEKMPFLGGTSLFAEGMFAVESPIQARENIPLTKEQAFKSHMMGTHWRANASLVQQFIEISAQNITWLQEMGLQFAHVVPLWPGGPRTWHIVQGGGKALIQTLSETAQKKGVQVFLGTPVVQFVHEDNRIVGVVAQDKDGKKIEIEAKAVIISCGGFTSNPEMITQFTQAPPSARPVIDLQQTGEVIQMAWAFGAATDGAGVLLSVPAVVGETPHSHLWAAGIQPQLWVNRKGERFCDETLFFQFPYAANALADQVEGTMYCIFDEQAKQAMVEMGVPIGLGVFVPPGSRLERLDQDLERGVRENKAVIANSIGELAARLGVDRATLSDTIRSYNDSCDNRSDGLYAKDPTFLQPIRKPDFYAIQVSYHIFTTLGGIKINHRTEVVNQNQEAIPGLYAAGNCAAGMYGEDYEVSSSGGALGFAVSSGRIAARNALEFLKQTH